jgi:hypothetical protein
MITTTNDDQHQILKDILTLYLPGEETFECDCTYGNGQFYKHLPRPKYCYDTNPKFEYVANLPSSQLHTKHQGLKSLVYDPPYIHAPGKSSIMGNRFGGYRNHSDRMKDYYSTLSSAYFSLAPEGILVFKCQDIVESGQQKMVHCKVWEKACTSGFKSLDLFVLTNKTVIKGWNHSQQKHARKTHSYFWVFKKTHG